MKTPIPLPPPDYTENVQGFVHDTLRHYYSAETMRAYAERLHAARVNGPAIMQAIGLLTVLQSWIGPRRPGDSEAEDQALWDQIGATRIALTPLARPSAPADALPTYTDDLELRYAEACEERDHLREVLKTTREAPQPAAPWGYAVGGHAEVWAGRWVRNFAATGQDKAEGKPLYEAVTPATQGDRLSQAARDVLTERQRQISAEGWTPEHDDEHGRGEMAIAAGCYAMFARGWPRPGHCPGEWPWDAKWWKPVNDRRNLVISGALILAELERLDRATARVQRRPGAAA